MPLTRVLAGLLVVSACTTATPPPPATPAEQPVRGGVIVQPIAQDVTTLQPLLATDSTTAEVVDLLYDRLWNPDPHTSEPRPHLASWQASPDAQTFTWQIAPTATWSDGRPIVAADVLTTLKAFGSSRKASTANRKISDMVGYADFAAGRADEIKGFVADPSDARRFSVSLSVASCGIPLQDVKPLPAHVFGKYVATGSGLARDAFDRAPENEAPAVTSGPFVLAEWRRNDRISLTRNPAYWRGAPLLDGFAFEIGRDDTWVDRLQRGLVGYMVWNVRQRDALAALEADPRVRVHWTADNSYLFIAWNTQSLSQPALRERRIRQALAYGLNGDEAWRKLRDGRGTRTFSHHVPPFWAHTSGLNEYPYDPGRARKLIEEAGYASGPDGLYQRDGRPLRITIEADRNNPERLSLAQFAADQYRLIGVSTELVARSFAELLPRATSDAFEAVILGFSLPIDGDPFATWHSSQIPDSAARRPGNNIARFASPAIDAAIVAARQGPDCSPATRKNHYETFNRILNEEQPFFFAFSGLRVRATRADLRGFDPPIYGNDTYDVHRWWIAPGKK